MVSKLKSRKFWVAVIAGALIGANEALGLNIDPSTINAIVAVGVGYIFGQSYVDGKHEEKAK